MKRLCLNSALSILPVFNFIRSSSVNVSVPTGSDRNSKSFRKRAMAKAYFFLIFMFSFINGFTQSTFSRNTIYGEFGGDGIFLSAHYERQLGTKPGFGVHFGLGNADADENFAFTIPIGLVYLFNISNQESFIETGVGVTWALQNIWDNYSHTEPHDYKPGFISSVSFRHHTPYGLMWKVSALTAFSKNNIIPFYPGLSIGWRF